MLPNESLLLFLQKRGLTINSYSTQKHHHNSNSHNKQWLWVKLHSLGFLPLSSCCLQDKRHIDYPLHFTSHPKYKIHQETSQSWVVWHMTYFVSSSFHCFLVATNKNNHKTIDKTFSITHDTLIQPVASLIQNNPAFQPIQNKTILTTSSFHDVFAKIFHLITHAPP